MTEELHPEERSAPRHRVLKGAMMTFKGARASIPCMVRDISDGGARIKVQPDVHIPGHFDLLVELDGYTVECKTIWRDGVEAGLQFTGEQLPINTMREQIVTAHTITKPTLRK